ncbi:CTP synthetase [Candidatus Pacearchaeota archaeon CG_4_9_14_3_um_filter_31_7]|nr:MAG: CTP synthetase [Candidatus Pacearchaeota archaeon CG_4_9_14_3_um_filter_31_7]
MKKERKFILVAGGVMSGVGKGITTASIGKILQDYGFKISTVKIDPYINYDAGTLRPTEHGEVFVTYDGGEIDQDLRNYERFLNKKISKDNNITTGKVYKTIIKKERAGEYLGKTVQFIPHVPEEIIRRINLVADKEDADIVVIELGGTIGDFENIPYLFAMKSLEKTFGKDSVTYVLVTYLPVLQNVGEMKTKPTQQSVRLLSQNGIYPDFIICRGREELDEPRKKKIEVYANIPTENVISAPDIKTIYRVPLNFEKEDLGKKILEKLNLKPLKKPERKFWIKAVNNIEKPKNKIKIAMVGKYVDIGKYSIADSYISIIEALKHASAKFNIGVEIEMIDSKLLEKNKSLNFNFDGILIPGGFGASGVEGKIKAIEYARKDKIPFLGLCYGLQLAVVEYSRNICNLKAHTTEINKKIPDSVIDVLPEQIEILKNNNYGATMRLGEYAAILKKGSIVYELYKTSSRLKKDKSEIESIAKSEQKFRLGKLKKDDIAILERHRHRYEVNPKYTETLEKHGLIFSGYHHRLDNIKLMEFIELPKEKHPFFVATQAHPEFKSTLLKPSPLFEGFVKACLRNKKN